jgi:hypothetical protein
MQLLPNGITKNPNWGLILEGLGMEKADILCMAVRNIFLPFGAFWDHLVIK